MADTTFSRIMLQTTHKRLKKLEPKINPWTQASVIESSVGGVNRLWFFEVAPSMWRDGDRDRFSDYFRADDAYEARSKGWDAWMAKYHPES